MAQREPIGRIVLKTLKSGFEGSIFLGFYYGYPMVIPTSKLPCIIVEKDTTVIEVGSTAHDTLTEKFTVKVVLNKRDDFGKEDTVINEQGTMRKLEDYTESIDDSTNDYMEMTVMGILRKQLTLNQRVINQHVVIDYGVNPRPDTELTAEVHITINVDKIALIPVRQ